MYDGDPILIDAGDGGDLLIVNGQPEMDDGLQNAVFLSLFTDNAWWANSILPDNEQATSELSTLDRSVLTNKTRLDAEEYARQALSWMVSDGLASKISVSAEIVAIGVLGLIITIDQPGKQSTVRYKINWENMAVQI